MNREEMIRLHDRHNEEELNQGDLSVVDEIFAPGYVRHVTGMPDIVGREAEKQFESAIRAGFPDIHFTIEDRFVDGDRLFVRWSAQGTHQGEYLGIPATGKPVTVAGMVIHRIEEGQFQESWDIFDNLGMLQQLGLVPEMGG
jgi:steroid delta-isomerase-like uncharacterized protein